MARETLPSGPSRVFIIGFENFSFYYLPRRARIVSRRQAPNLDSSRGPNDIAAASEEPVPPPRA